MEMLPPAPERLERLAQKLWESGLSAQEWAGRHGGNVFASSLQRYEYSTPALTAWVRELGKILHAPELLEKYQRQYLTAEEFAAIQADLESL